MEVEELIKDLADSFKNDLFKFTDNPMLVEIIVDKFKLYLFKLLQGADTIRKQDLQTILNKHFISGKELDRDKLLKDLLNILG